MQFHRQTMSLDPLFPEDHYEGMIEAFFLLRKYDEALELVDRWSSPKGHIHAYGAACASLAGYATRSAQFAQQFAETTPEDYSNAAFVAALLRYHTRAEDREHWLKGFEAANIPEMDLVRRSGLV
jgi:hypothetical protein